LATGAPVDHPSLLEGRVAIVTGGSSGIGKSVCCALAAAGVSLVVVGRNQARLAVAVNEIRAAARSSRDQGRVIGLSLDVGNEQDMATMAQQAIKHFGRIDILVASAGMLRPAHSRPNSVDKVTLAELETVLDTNLKGVFLSNRAVLKTMISQRSGQIINVASLSGRKALPLDAPYCASKFAVIGLTESLAEEVGPFGIRVHSLLPGNTDTPIWGQNRLLPKAARVIPVERVAEVVVFLLQTPRDTYCQEFSIAPHNH
jgi:NAD(P)-dependent dehydrogenase (short-subunit alcohol dehydrogenase family)